MNNNENENLNRYLDRLEAQANSHKAEKVAGLIKNERTRVLEILKKAKTQKQAKQLLNPFVYPFL